MVRWMVIWAVALPLFCLAAEDVEVQFLESKQKSERFASLLDHFEGKVQIATYHPLPKKMVSELIAAKERGCEIEVLFNTINKRHEKGALALKGAHIPVYCMRSVSDRKTEQMHHEFCIFRNSQKQTNLIWQSEMNMLKQRSLPMRDTVAIYTGDQYQKQFYKEFELLKNLSRVY
ncbi:MAG: hypothetical protein S4CHLAM102_09900 [Chlamydiia bacterium]|nr:hypothetical protein [Chlamydiia bacterium]